MRSRYYNPEIKRFINQDVLIGSIGNSNSLNRYSYVEGNPVSYTDPFGLSPYKWISLGIHTALDVAGIWFPVADVANAFYYLFEGNPVEFGKSLILAIPGSDFLSIGTKFSAKLGKYSKLSEGIVKGVNAAGHIGSAAIMAYETGSAIGKMIDKYLVYDNELSKETAVEVGLIVLGCYGTAKYSDILAKYMGGLGGSVRPESLSENSTYYQVPSEKELNDALCEWSKMQKSLAPSKSKVVDYNTSSIVFDIRTGKYYYGMNKGICISGESLNDDLSDILPTKSFNEYRIGNCAEVDAVNQAMNDNANLGDLYIYTIDCVTDKNKIPLISFGTPKKACANCTYSFKGKVASIISGCISNY